MKLSAITKTLASILTTKGDVLGYSTTEARIPVGANDTVLTADSAQTLGLKWAAAAGGGKLESLDAHKASGTESSYTFTPAAALSPDDYSEIIVIAKGPTTSATDLEAIINGITSGDYNQWGYKVTTSAITFEGDSAEALLDMKTMTDTNGGNLHILQISYNGDRMSWQWKGGNGNSEQFSMQGSLVNLSVTEFTSIKLQMASSTWKAAFFVDTFGVKRT